MVVLDKFVRNNNISMETLIVRPGNKAQSNAVKAILKALNGSFEKQEEVYNAKFANKIKKSDAEFDDGKYETICPILLPHPSKPLQKLLNACLPC